MANEIANEILFAYIFVFAQTKTKKEEFIFRIHKKKQNANKIFQKKYERQ